MKPRKENIMIENLENFDLENPKVSSTLEVENVENVSTTQEVSTSDKTKNVVLLPHQGDHVVKLLEIFEKSNVAFDLSMLGLGKTYTTTKLAEISNFKNVIVIAPVSVKSKWVFMRDTFGLPLKECVSFCELRSTKCKQPKHGLLTRRDYTSTMLSYGQVVTVDNVEFTGTPLLQSMLDEGALVVIDEIQNVKNLSTQFHACRAIITKAMESAKSRVLMISGSPIDKKEQAVHLFRCLGVMKSQKMIEFNLRDFAYEDAGFFEIVQFCKRYSILNDADDMILQSRRGVTECVRLTYRLFQRVVKRRLSSSMTPPTSATTLSKKNGFFEIRDPESRTLLEQAVDRLSNVTRYDPENRTVDFGRNGARIIAAITYAMMQLETAKISTFERLASERLSKDENNKVVLCVNYTATIDDLVEKLKMFEPLVLRGSMDFKRREKTLAKFQAPNNEHRLLIANLAVISTGIDLDDKDGGYPRTVFVSPQYGCIQLYQLCHRFQRIDTKSSCDIFMVYGKHASETRILDALSRKSEIMKETTEKQVKSGVVFPGDFENYEEVEV